MNIRPRPRPLLATALSAATALVVALAGLGGCALQCPIRLKPPRKRGSDAVVARLKDTVVLVDVTLEMPDGQERGCTGSGFVISDDGRIVTNEHVVAPRVEEDGRTLEATGRKVKVIFHSGTPQEESVPAEVARENAQVDLALLKIDRKTPVYLDLGDSDAVSETTKVYAAGHPLGLREISIRTGTVTARRFYEGHHYLEHDAATEGGNSGGPVVDEQCRVLGVHELTLGSENMLTKLAIPSNVVRDWLASAPSQDPQRPKPGEAIAKLLEAAKLVTEGQKDGVFSLPYDNGVTVFVHKYRDFLRVYVPLGAPPGGDRGTQGSYAIRALRFNYSDPVGRISLQAGGGKSDLFWECQMPFGVVTAEYLGVVCKAAAKQGERWAQLVSDKEQSEMDYLYPGGDENTLRAQLQQTIEGAKLKYEDTGKYFKLPYDNGVDVRASIYDGMARVSCFTGGLPGQEGDEQAGIALELLQRNWSDSFGRLSLDPDRDLVWESQVPASFLTSDYLAMLASTCANQVADFWQKYGHVPFHGD
jgi:S1-C subfamily serine protease